MKHYKSVFENEQELIRAILDIHLDTDTFDCDPMYFKGNFYKSIPKPKYKFDINPQVPECKYGDATNLPISDKKLRSIMLDPPFLFGIHGKADKYYSARTHTIFAGFDELEKCYKGILSEAYRVLDRGGVCVFKCQDYTDSKTTMTHCKVYEWANEIGFYAKDIAILVLPNKVYNSHTHQRHLRKIHTYFWVFIKNAKEKGHK